MYVRASVASKVDTETYRMLTGLRVANASHAGALLELATIYESGEPRISVFVRPSECVQNYKMCQ